MTLLYIEQHDNVFEVRLKTDVALNAWQGRVLLPADLRVQGVSYGGSVGDVWQAPPALSGLQIYFAGGSTSAFTGDGMLFRFTAAPVPVAPLELISFDAKETAVYGANGRGTPMAATLQPITINARDLSLAAASRTSSAVIPEPFTITAVQDPQILNGKPAIIFSAVDDSSGIDHYEIEEHTENGIIGWHLAASPYVIDSKTTMISVKAVDRDGNSRVESITFPGSGFTGTWTGFWLGTFLLGILVTGLLIQQWRKKSSH